MINVNLFNAFNWYGFIIGSGMIVCIVIAVFNAKKRGYYSELVYDIALCCIPLAIVGARAYYIIFDIIDPNTHTDWTFKRIIGLEGGLQGLAIYGGLIGATLGSLIVLALQRKKPKEERVSFLQMADLAFTVVILGQAIGRWGNFANQEAYGNMVTNPSLQWFPYAVYIDSEGAYFQATFFYESFWNLIGFGLLMWIYNGKHKSFDGFSLSCYCIWYGFGRFFIEGLRSDSLWLVPNVVRVSQVVSAIIFLFGVGFILYHFIKARSVGKMPFVLIPEDDLDDSFYGYEKSFLSHPKKTTVKKQETEQNISEYDMGVVDDKDNFDEKLDDENMMSIDAQDIIDQAQNLNVDDYIQKDDNPSDYNDESKGNVDKDDKDIQ